MVWANFAECGFLEVLPTVEGCRKDDGRGSTLGHKVVVLWAGREPNRDDKQEANRIVSIKLLKKEAKNCKDLEPLGEVKSEEGIEKEARDFTEVVKGLMSKAEVKLKAKRGNPKNFVIEKIEMCEGEVLKHKGVQKQLNSIVGLIKTGAKEGAEPGRRLRCSLKSLRISWKS